MSDVFKSNPPILLLELEEVDNNVGPVLINMENVLHYQVIEGQGTIIPNQGTASYSKYIGNKDA